MIEQEHRTEPADEPQSLLKQFLSLRRAPWENLATVVIALGVFMLMQPFWITFYSYSFITMLVGTFMFIVVSKFPD